MKDFACQSKAKAKPQRREPAGSSPRTIPIGKRIWTDVEPGEYSLSDNDISKKLIHLLRHNKQLHREDDGAVQIWRIKENLQQHFPYCHHWSDCMWKKSMAGGGNKKRYQYCTDSSGTILYLRVQDAILLILLNRTMLLFRATSSSTFIMLDVQSICILSSIRDFYLEGKI